MEFEDFVQAPIDPETIHLELEREYPFYRKLNVELKHRFLERIGNFIEQKKFVARQSLVLNDTVRIIISACAVQVTFGLDTYTLDTFEYIVIYPDVYESPITKKMHKGETNLNGFICLSWKHILEGIEKPNDNYNLGLHEWTHALRFNSIKYEETDYFFDGYINKWVACAYHEYNNLKSGRPSIFRKYGATNIHEFLSVVVEHFFESPDEFREKAKDLFIQLCILLNQEPDNEHSTQINVRDLYLQTNEDTPEEPFPPVLVFEASFWRTLLNLKWQVVRVLFILIILLPNQNLISNIISFLIILSAVVYMNGKYFTIMFYENSIYLQSGFVQALSRKLTVNYHSLIKLEIYDSNLDITDGKAFQLNYYNGNKFIKKTAYCSAIDVPHEKITSFLARKNVLILFPD